MLLATLNIIAPAFSSSRPLGWALAFVFPEGTAFFFFLWACLGALVWHDFSTRRRLDPATIWAIAMVIAIFAVAVAVAVEFRWRLDYVRWAREKAPQGWCCVPDTSAFDLRHGTVIANWRGRRGLFRHRPA